MPRPFQLFNLPPQFDLDPAELEQTYRRLAARFHPDNTATASAFEQKQAVMMAAAVNEAYRLLSQPLERAVLLLQAQGIQADSEERTAFDPEFLMQQMEWREELADARAESSTERLAALDKRVAAEEAQLLSKLSAAFQAANYAQAAEIVPQGRFLAKLRQEIRAAL
ncbi:Fe-S protein assembly co-chaperone HscB [Eikenella sp. S3360]|uniref:Co-chaperone protein HscB homolog n=1 Tax=Eikenella glucosivorans TaxID=2766967 RepID=A0ABS0N952_9NEIS|nr:Fe-S protein assembly co-chaperone HscB [Eikenella glucosivorans]MBH5328794.1 Fe-S protein assembly co-chaperone HscB [Eikenella glucosivorans]